VAEHLRKEPRCAEVREVSLGLQELDGGVSAKLCLEVVGDRGRDGEDAAAAAVARRCEAATDGRLVVGRGSGAGWRATPGGREGRPSRGSTDWSSEEGWALLDP
jgi:hypothetical protein